MLFSPSYGFIAPHESVKVIMVLTAADTWQRDPASYVGKIHKVVAENMIMNKELKVPEEIKVSYTYIIIFIISKPSC